MPSLDALIDAGHDVAVVVTRPDRRRGRGGALTPSPVKARRARTRTATSCIASPTSTTLTSNAASSSPTARSFPSAPRRGADAQRALLAAAALARRGARSSARSSRATRRPASAIMTLEASLDTGPVHLERRSATIDDKTRRAVARRTRRRRAPRRSLRSSRAPSCWRTRTPQTGEATYAEKLTKETFHLVALDADRCSPSAPCAWAARTSFVDGKRIAVERASSVTRATVARRGDSARRRARRRARLRDGALVLEEVRPEGSSTMDARAWWRGLRRETARVEPRPRRLRRRLDP